MLYDRKIRYLDYCENGERIKGAGFVKLEVRDGRFRMDLNVRGIPCMASFAGDVILCGKGKEYALGQIALERGTGEFRHECHLNGGIGGSEIKYQELNGIRISVGEKKAIQCFWQEEEAAIPREPEVKAAEGPDGRRTNKSIGKRGLAEAAEGPAEKEIYKGGGRRGTAEAAEGMTEREAYRGSSQRRSSESTESTVERETYKGSVQRRGSVETAAGQEGPGEREIYKNSSQRGLAETAEGMESMAYRGSSKRAPSEAAESTAEGKAYKSSVQRWSAETAEAPAEREAYRGSGQRGPSEAMESKPRGTLEATEGKPRGTSEVTESKPERNVSAEKGKEYHQNKTHQALQPAHERTKMTGVSEGESAAEMSKYRRERMPIPRRGGAETSRAPAPVVLQEDKWLQLSAIYPHIRPFRDERDYLSIGPADFVVFSSESYQAANNSFLLHGYYNYRHLIFSRMERRGEILYYIGVPGNYYEREKQVAVMFGFESFECAEEPAQSGDFGYYMMRVRI